MIDLKEPINLSDFAKICNDSKMLFYLDNGVSPLVYAIETNDRKFVLTAFGSSKFSWKDLNHVSGFNIMTKIMASRVVCAMYPRQVISLMCFQPYFEISPARSIMGLSQIALFIRTTASTYYNNLPYVYTALMHAKLLFRGDVSSIPCLPVVEKTLFDYFTKNKLSLTHPVSKAIFHASDRDLLITSLHMLLDGYLKTRYPFWILLTRIPSIISFKIINIITRYKSIESAKTEMPFDDILSSLFVLFEIPDQPPSRSPIFLNLPKNKKQRFC